MSWLDYIVLVIVLVVFYDNFDRLEDRVKRIEAHTVITVQEPKQ